jgi:hypothetical protein
MTSNEILGEREEVTVGNGVRIPGGLILVCTAIMKTERVARQLKSVCLREDSLWYLEIGIPQIVGVTVISSQNTTFISSQLRERDGRLLAWRGGLTRGLKYAWDDRKARWKSLELRADLPRRALYSLFPQPGKELKDP